MLMTLNFADLPAPLEIKDVVEWFLTSDNRMLHIKNLQEHMVVPVDKLHCFIVKP